MSLILQTAIIGLGIMGRRMLENMAAIQATSLSRFGIPMPRRADLHSLSRPTFGSPHPREAMAGADLVYLACPPVPRKDYSLEAATAGKAVFLAKPFGVDVGESEALVAGLRASGVPVAANFTQAAGEALTDVAKAADSGVMGDILGADMVVIYADWPRA